MNKQEHSQRIAELKQKLREGFSRKDLAGTPEAKIEQSMEDYLDSRAAYNSFIASVIQDAGK